MDDQRAIRVSREGITVRINREDPHYTSIVFLTWYGVARICIVPGFVVLLIAKLLYGSKK